MPSQKFFHVKIDASSIKVLNASLHLMHKVGRDLVVEVEENLLTIRALNDSKSAFGSVEFEPNFFDEYELTQDGPFSCRLPVKPICMVMRNAKNVRHITISAQCVDAEPHLSFSFHNTNGIVRSYHFNYQDCEILNAVFDEDDCSHLKVRPKVMAQLLDYIHRSPEIVLTASKQAFSVRSFHASDTMQGKERSHRTAISTGLAIHTQEFDLYDYRSSCNTVEFVQCVREAAALVAFAELLDVLALDFYFSEAGRAIKLGCRQEYYAVSLVLATLEHTSASSDMVTQANPEDSIAQDHAEEDIDVIAMAEEEREETLPLSSAALAVHDAAVQPVMVPAPAEKTVSSDTFRQTAVAFNDKKRSRKRLLETSSEEEDS